jgi:hypothetical protein
LTKKELFIRPFVLDVVAVVVIRFQLQQVRTLLQMEVTIAT